MIYTPVVAIHSKHPVQGCEHMAWAHCRNSNHLGEPRALNIVFMLLRYQSQVVEGHRLQVMRKVWISFQTPRKDTDIFKSHHSIKKAREAPSKQKQVNTPMFLRTLVVFGSAALLGVVFEPR
jgi:hypothetical protein